MTKITAMLIAMMRRFRGEPSEQKSITIANLVAPIAYVCRFGFEHSGR